MHLYQTHFGWVMTRIMKLLFDTHAFIWWYSEPKRLSSRVLEACQDPGNTLMLSIASVWEMQIKSQLGKLRLDDSLTDIFQKEKDQNLLQILPITLPVVLAIDNLPLHHRDPFDRLLIAQTTVAQALLVSKDSQFRRYDVPLFWS